MVLEASHIKNASVLDATGTRLGAVDEIIYLADEARIFGFQVNKSGVLNRFAGLEFAELIALNQRSLVVDSSDSLTKDMKEFDKISKSTGSVLGVRAKTESGKSLGRVSDLLIDADSGFIIRFYIRNLISERIIPRQFLVRITPREIVFKDIVDTPVFDQAAIAEAAGTSVA